MVDETDDTKTGPVGPVLVPPAAAPALDALAMPPVPDLAAPEPRRNARSKTGAARTSPAKIKAATAALPDAIVPPVAVDAVASVIADAPAMESVKPAAASQKTESPAPRKEPFTMNTATEFTEKFQSSFKDASEKAKAAFGDMGTFAKGNVEAMVESSKILATGLQEMGKGYVAESKSAMETLTAELKELTTVKSPTEFFEKQSALLRKQFDAAVATSSKNSEAMLKLATEAFQPISTRVSLAVEKMKQAA